MRSSDAIEQRLRVPGTQKEPDPTARRQRQPESPERRPLPLVLGGLIERPVHDPPGVHPLVEQAHGFALARAIDAAEDHDDRERGPLERALQVEQFPAQLRDFELVLVPGDRAADFRGFEHVRWPPPVRRYWPPLRAGLER
jgi:hypothetical protein